MVRRHVKRTRAALLGLAALVLAVAVSSTACQRDTTASAQTARTNRAEMRTVTVPVDGGRVKNTLKDVHGVQDAVVNLEKHDVTVQYENGKVSVDQLTRAVNELGYKAGVPTPAQLQ